MNTRSLRAILGGLCAIGAGLSLVWVVAGVGELCNLRPAQGTVIGYEREFMAPRRDSLRYFPVIRYTNMAGQTFSFRSEAPLVRPAYATGAVVGVLYCPRPGPYRHERIDSGKGPWGRTGRFVLTAIAPMLALLFAVAAYALLNGRSIREVVLSVRHARKPS
jgi:hypothetical protein